MGGATQAPAYLKIAFVHVKTVPRVEIHCDYRHDYGSAKKPVQVTLSSQPKCRGFDRPSLLREQRFPRSPFLCVCLNFPQMQCEYTLILLFSTQNQCIFTREFLEHPPNFRAFAGKWSQTQIRKTSLPAVVSYCRVGPKKGIPANK